MKTTAAPWILEVKVTPGARREEILGWQDGRLALKVRAPAQDGRANEAVLELLAHTLQIRKRHLTVLAGSCARLKKIQITDISPAAAHTLLSKSYAVQRSDISLTEAAQANPQQVFGLP